MSPADQPLIIDYAVHNRIEVLINGQSISSAEFMLNLE
jgi:hypothetical protein